MFANILPSNETLFEGAGTEDRVLLEAVRAGILQRASGGGEFPVSSAGVDWQQVCDVAVRNKLVVPLLRGLPSDVRLPQNFRAMLEEERDAVVPLNTRNLLTLRYLAPGLEAKGVRAVVLKGPCAQMLVHGSFFEKPSLDVDLLVSPGDFETAGRVLAEHGFAPAKQSSSPWWKFFLGEQAFLSPDRKHAAVDLHHRVQQPGCPAPRDGEAFLSQPATVAIGSTRVHTLSRPNTVLLSCMSLAKAIIQREPAGGYVCDVATGIACMTQGEIGKLAGNAGRQGLRNTLALGLRAARLLFGVQAQPGPGRWNILEDVADAQLIKMILRPSASDIPWPRRSATLRELCDTRAAFLKEMGWKLASEMCRNLYERTAGHRDTRAANGPAT
jgi:hypothetical protein